MAIIDLFTVANPSNSFPTGELKEGQLYNVEIPGVRSIMATDDPAGDAARSLEYDQYSPNINFALVEKKTGKTVFLGLIGETARRPLPEKSEIPRWDQQSTWGQ